MANESTTSDMSASDWEALWGLVGAPTFGGGNPSWFDMASDAVIEVLSDIGFNADTVPDEVQSAMMAGYILALKDRDLGLT